MLSPVYTNRYPVDLEEDVYICIHSYKVMYIYRFSNVCILIHSLYTYIYIYICMWFEAECLDTLDRYS